MPNKKSPKKSPQQKKDISNTDLARMIDSFAQKSETRDLQLADMIESLAISTAKGFERVDEQFKKVDEQFVSTRQDIMKIRDDFVPRHEFNDFKERFVKLEAKVLKK